MSVMRCWSIFIFRRLPYFEFSNYYVYINDLWIVYAYRISETSYFNFGRIGKSNLGWIKKHYLHLKLRPSAGDSYLTQIDFMLQAVVYACHVLQGHILPSKVCDWFTPQTVPRVLYSVHNMCCLLLLLQLFISLISSLESSISAIFNRANY